MHSITMRWCVRRRDTGEGLDYRGKSFVAVNAAWLPLEQAELLIAEAKEGLGPPCFTQGVVAQLYAAPVPICACCGSYHPDEVAIGIFRCWKHREKNPCAIEGCDRTHAAKGYLSDNDWLCSHHWRALVPPRSPMRRLWLRIWRVQKKRGGWTPELRSRAHRLWDAIIRRARQAASGGEAAIDEAEINRLFGW